MLDSRRVNATSLCVILFLYPFPEAAGLHKLAEGAVSWNILMEKGEPPSELLVTLFSTNPR